MKLLLIDSRTAGVAGDMFLAALIDLLGVEAPIHRAAEAVEAELGGRVEVELKEVVRGGLRAKRVVVEAEPRGLKASRAAEAAYGACIKAGGSRRAAEFARRVFLDLAEAERRVHGLSGEEAGWLAELDAFIEVVGAALMLDEGGFFEAEVCATPIPLGGGVIKVHRGAVKGPAPATLELLRMHGHPTAESWVDEELSTPTGVALVVNAASRVVEWWPPMRVEAVGYGAGSREVAGLANVLRMVAGTKAQAALSEVAVLEAAVDDVSGEVVGRAIDELLEAGALDVYVTPSLGKKGRPCLQVKVLAQPGREVEVAEEVLRRLGTLGVRLRLEPRLVAERCVREVEVEVGGRRWRVKVKESTTPRGGLLAVKPEFKDVERIASELKRPVREVWSEVYSKVVEEAERARS